MGAAHGHFYMAVRPVLLSIGIFTGGWLALILAKHYAPSHGAVTVAALAAFMTADLAINNGPNRSTAQIPSYYDEMRPDTKNETVTFLKAHLKEQQGSSRRDRVEMVSLGFDWPNISLIHDFDHTLGYNPLRLAELVEGIGANETVAEIYERKFTPLFPSYRSTMADLLGLRYIAIDRPIEKLDAKLKPGDLTLIANTRNAYIYENPRALPRVLFAFDWQPANFEQMAKDGRWPLTFDPRRTVLLRGMQPNFAAAQLRPVSLAGSDNGARYLPEYRSAGDRRYAASGFPCAERRVAPLVVRHGGRQAGGHPSRKCAVQGHPGAGGQACGPLRVQARRGRRETDRGETEKQDGRADAAALPRSLDQARGQCAGVFESCWVSAANASPASQSYSR